ncbi:CDP-glycerol glycerophosphotransferase family protein [Pseudomonas sp. GL-B-19]|uniref:CDP-glycerol glycerophosphotransferase family protein n=1 Tax=Pseudomonas sp. GL-B-19 TaxID=2832393 RepID=UPI001CBC2169|nr:CDP-glycerol glycerophosphotransferase family protein [Pseudomonas sp. GL-B-19]
MTRKKRKNKSRTRARNVINDNKQACPNFIVEKSQQPLPFSIPSELLRKESTSTYSIIAAVYNVELYLHAFFESIVNQTIDFERYIEIILVDDGSTDGSAEIIKEWVAKYPFNIKYFKQSNAGQAQARNNGLRYAKHEWLTFVDPDDFLSLNYFEEIDACFRKARSAGKELKMVSANMIFFMENRNEFSDGHALRFRFASGDVLLPANDLGKFIQLSASTAVFKRTRVLSENLYFNPLIRPAFEDGHFVNRYLLGLTDGHIAFISEPKYYYRKRENGTSTIDTAWEKPGRFDAQLRLGYLSLINESLKKHGTVKTFIQRTILYDLAWHFKRFINDDGKLSHLTSVELEKYKNLVREIMQHISFETILNFELAGLWFFQKFGLISYYKNTEPKFNITYIDEADELRDLIKIRYFTRHAHTKEILTLDSKPTIPVFDKTRKHVLFGEAFLYERIIWVKAGDTKSLFIQVEGKQDTRMTLKGKQHKAGVEVSEIFKSFRPTPVDANSIPEDVKSLRLQALDSANRLKYANCWVFMDRNSFADDNAEHLYRYIKENQSHQNIYFVLDQTSPDWIRLAEENFNLIPYGSDEHKIALLNAVHLISSHADHYVFGGLTNSHTADLRKYKFTFLQHGIIKDDLSGWLNNKNIHCFVTSSKREYESICHGDSYKFSEREMVLTGLPRHDRLRSLPRNSRPSILIMPTWRHDLVGQASDNGFEREKQPGFAESEYTIAWKAFLHSPKLKAIAEEQNLEIVFFPHANVQPYLDDFEVPSYVKLGTHNPGISMQQYFADCEVLVTDYSSVAFDVAALDKKVIYFQFDHDVFFNGSHTYTKGYYSYESDGFGPVCKTLDSSLNALAKAANNTLDHALYQQRRNDTFAFHDTLNCERVYKSIVRLERNTVSAIDLSRAVRRTATKAMQHSNWDLALHAWERLIDNSPRMLSDSDAAEYSRTLRELREYEKCNKWHEKLKALDMWSDRMNEEQIAVGFELNPTGIAIDTYELYTNKFKGKKFSPQVVAAAAKHYRKIGNIAQALEQFELSTDMHHPSILSERAEIAEKLDMWSEAEKLWMELREISYSEDLSFRVVRAQYKQNFYEKALKELNTIKTPVMDESSNIIAGEVFFVNSKWKEADKCWTAAADADDFTSDHWLKLARARRRNNQIAAATEAFKKAHNAVDERTRIQEKALLSLASAEWDAAIQHLNEFIARKDLNPNRDATVDLALALHQSGNTKAAKKTLTQYCQQFGNSPRTEKAWAKIKQPV